MDAAGVALRWVRHLLPVRHAEPAAWATVERVLDALDRPVPMPRGLLALAGLRLLSSVGYALELERCTVCERPCPLGAPAFVDAVRGGIVCRSCGGRGRLLDGATRALAAEAQRSDEPTLAPPPWLTAARAEDLLVVLEAAMAAHADLDPSR
jgi:DNA repair protein RecO (recombination protein O)